MRKLLTPFALLLVLCAATSAQTATPSKDAPIDFSDVAKPAPTPPAKYITWHKDCPVCDDYVANDERIRLIRNGGLTVAVALSDDGRNFVVEVAVINGTDARVLVDPAQTLFVIRDGEKEQLAYRVTPEHVAGKIKGRANWGNFFRSLSASMATRTATSQSETNGSVYVTGTGGSANSTFNANTTTTRSPDYAARREAAIANRAAVDEADARARAVLDSALRANTLFPNRYITGAVYFERKKFHKLAAFIIQIEGIFYEFQTGPAK
jgi:hypothetical protein